MKYKFKKTDYSYNENPTKETTYDYGVVVFDKSIEALEQIESFAWTSKEVQQLIDDSNALNGEEELDYQVYGGHLFMRIDKVEVYFYNFLNNQQEADFIWSFKEFIDFMQAFKNYLESEGV